jgi:hypothetical protein
MPKPKRFRDLASASAYCEKQGCSFTWIKKTAKGYTVAEPKVKTVPKAAKFDPLKAYRSTKEGNPYDQPLPWLREHRDVALALGRWILETGEGDTELLPERMAAAKRAKDRDDLIDAYVELIEEIEFWADENRNPDDPGGWDWLGQM